MTIKTSLGNGLIVIGSYLGTKTAVLAATTNETIPKSTELADTTLQYSTKFSDPYSLVGFVVPNWWGIVFYIAFLVIGSAFSINQKTPIDDKFKYPFMRPFYSLAFGSVMTLFVLPQFYEGITIWGLIWPALFCTSIGGVVIYYVIDFFTSRKLWAMISDWGYKAVAEYLKGLPSRIKAAIKAFAGGDK
ncbi:hypothetical protein ACTXGO_00900 [Psychrobacter sp. T6-1]|uniref:hypothetical protein n=1 Tax=Psychrobacter sp. T6-1 TaxID=3457447 RepID=UPI003FD52A86